MRRKHKAAWGWGMGGPLAFLKHPLSGREPGNCVMARIDSRLTGDDAARDQGQQGNEFRAKVGRELGSKGYTARGSNFNQERAYHKAPASALDKDSVYTFIDTHTRNGLHLLLGSEKEESREGSTPQDQREAN